MLLENKRNNQEHMAKLKDLLLQPAIGMKLASEDDTYNFYNRYALHTGFSTQKGMMRYNKKGVLRQRE